MPKNTKKTRKISHQPPPSRPVVVNLYLSPGRTLLAVLAWCLPDNLLREVIETIKGFLS